MQVNTTRLAHNTSPANADANYNAALGRSGVNVAEINRQSRFWCFTVNNPLRQFDTLPDGVTYLVSGAETCPTTGTQHLQCYCELARSQRRSFVAKLFPTAHVEPRWSNAEKASEYCKKDGQFVEFGTLSTTSSKQGKRTDLENIAEDIRDGRPFEEIIEENPAAFMRYGRGIQNYRNAVHKPLEFRANLKVYLYIGKTRLGKSYHARVTQNAWPKPVGKGLWFDGYDRQKTVVVDEFRGQYPLSDMLQITDPYKVQVETKGGHTWFEPETLIFTTNMSPTEMYAERDADSREAFFARFHEVYWWYAKQQYMVLNEAQKATLFGTGALPPIPITAPTAVIPAPVFTAPKPNQPKPMITKFDLSKSRKTPLARQNATVNKETVQAGQSTTPKRVYNSTTRQLEPAKKQLKVFPKQTAGGSSVKEPENLPLPTPKEKNNKAEKIDLTIETQVDEHQLEESSDEVLEYVPETPPHMLRASDERSEEVSSELVSEEDIDTDEDMD